MRIGCSGKVSERSGIGVVQNYLYSHLRDAGHELVFSKSRDAGNSPINRIRGLGRGLQPVKHEVDVYLCTVPPFPFGVRAPSLTIVHDLRWLRTRSKLGTMYRAWDLRRSIHNSDALLCVSERTQLDLLRFEPDSASKAQVAWLGPGHIPDGSFRESASGALMLVGGAPHKQNELAAAVLTTAKPTWVKSIIGVGLSAQVKDILSQNFSCEWFDRISDRDMLSLYQRAQYFLMLGTNEGFGLPFIEALATGCQVIAMDHPLAREVIGDAGWLLRPGDCSTISLQLTSSPSVPSAIRRAQLEKFSWTAFGCTCEALLKHIDVAHRTNSQT